MGLNKKHLKKYLPPVFVDIARWLKRVFLYADWEYVKEGWSYTNPKIKGWNMSEIAQIQMGKWDRFAAAIKSPSSFGVNHESEDYSTPDLFSHNLLMSFNYVCALAAHKQDTLKLLDWGGGIGHYGQVAKEALPGIAVEYANYDLPVFEASFRQLFPGGHFIKSIDELSGGYDLVNISSSLWYDQQWKETLRKLSGFAVKYLYITRMIFVKDSPSYVAIQRPYAEGYHTEYLCWIFNENELINYVISLGYCLERKFFFDGTPQIYNAPEKGKLLGFVFIKKHE